MATVLVFARTAGFEWSGWDDGINVTANPGLHPVTLGSLLEFWRVPYQGLYIPVSYMLYAAETCVSRLLFPGNGLDPRLFHCVSVALHTTCVLLVWRILCTRISAGWPAVAGGLLFALHPLQVESVAWISEQRGLLSSALCLWMLGLSREDSSRALTRWLCLGLFTLAMLAKPQAVTAPLLLAVFDGTGSWRGFGASVRRSWPMVASAVVVSVITKLQQPSEWSWEGADVSVWLRPIVAGDAICFYVEKFLFPSGMCLDYGRMPHRVLANPMLVVRAIFVLASIVAICVVPRMRAIRMPVMIVVFGLLPVIGLVPFTFQGFSTVADRYAYLPMLGAAVGVAQATAHVRRSHVVPIAVGVAAWLVVLTWLTLAQVSTWRDSESLNRQIARVNPESPGGRLNLALALLRGGRIQEAAAELRLAVKANPDYAKARYELATTLHRLGLRQEAEEHYRAAVRLRPQWTYAHNDLGILLAEQGRFEEAIAHFREAVALRPDLPAQQMNLERAEAALKESSLGTR
jgi:hypothetical protein